MCLVLREGFLHVPSDEGPVCVPHLAGKSTSRSLVSPLFFLVSLCVCVCVCACAYLCGICMSACARVCVCPWAWESMWVCVCAHMWTWRAQHPSDRLVIPMPLAWRDSGALSCLWHLR